MNEKLAHWKMKGDFFRFRSMNIFYSKEGSGPCLLVCHGYPYNSFDFEPVWNELAKRFTLIAADMPGMGFSDKPEKHAYSFAEMADMYTALLQKFNILQAHILSHDLGNSVVQELIARNKEGRNPFGISSIAFLNGGLFSDVYKPRRIQVLLSKSPRPAGRLLSRLMTKQMVFRATAEVFGSDTKPSPALLEQCWEILNYNKGKSVTYLLGRLIFEKDEHQNRWIAAMQQTTVPMCFINGPADPNSGIHMANRYRELIPDANVIVLNRNIGHWPQIEAPHEVLAAFYQFQESLA